MSYKSRQPAVQAIKIIVDSQPREQSLISVRSDLSAMESRHGIARAYARSDAILWLDVMSGALSDDGYHDAKQASWQPDKHR